MTFINNLLQLLNSEMKRPIPYQSFSESWFHYLSFAFMMILAIFLSRNLKHATDRKVRKYLLVFSIVLLSFEIYKQVIFSYQSGWGYQWYAFPFQFCSTPMYIALLAALTRNKKQRDSLIAFLGTFGLFAGLAVMLYPMTVFISTVGINIQTMVHHGSMVAMGIALLSTQVKLESKTILKASLVFSILVSIAVILNAIHNTWIEQGTFNMFFINPILRNDLPILTLIQPLVPHIVFLFIYILGFMFVSYLVLLIGILLFKPKVKGLKMIYSKES